MALKDGDDLDFLKYGDNTYIVAKKNDLVNILTKANSVQQTKPAYKPTPTAARSSASPDARELEVLKKLDTLRYNDRTATKVSAMFNADEKAVLQVLIKKGMVSPFKKPGEKDFKYGIQKSVYDNFLYRNKKPSAAAVQEQAAKPRYQQSSQPTRLNQKAWEDKITGSDSFMDLLESKGFLVLNNEADAALVSASLEDSIRQGLVVGTRAFNKKFYIGLRGFINKNASKILKIIEQKSMDVDDISKLVGLEEDGVRTILYFLSESGDVTEVRRDIFRAA